MPTGADNYYKSDTVTKEKVTFKNQYRMTVAGNLFLPRDRNPDAKLPAIVVGHPMGAVKEQSADLYATKMAEQGFAALSVDLSFWGESGGEPRNAVAPVNSTAQAVRAAAMPRGTASFDVVFMSLLSSGGASFRSPRSPDGGGWSTREW